VLKSTSKNLVPIENFFNYSEHERLLLENNNNNLTTNLNIHQTIPLSAIAIKNIKNFINLAFLDFIEKEKKSCDDISTAVLIFDTLIKKISLELHNSAKRLFEEMNEVLLIEIKSYTDWLNEMFGIIIKV
jgi:hypothetical protein